ncbi:MAG TPA: YbjQ family protein, partial [Aggregatilineales bacterium]|nr:YbjQ family protein [Aggregatilineales bacterium]
MIITTTPNIEGQQITKYLGIVSGETILGANVFRDIGASWRNFFGGRAKAYEASLREAKEMALTDLVNQATQLGANAIVGV